MARRVLITGGAGFIGSHLADQLLAKGDEVVALDSLLPQVHGDGRRRPSYLDPAVELRVGDVEDPRAVRAALRRVDAVVHLAARVGVGQSMYQATDYTRTNNLGTAVLLEALAERPVERLVVASSMSVYGEGLYRDGAGRIVQQVDRRQAQLRRGRWEPIDEEGRALEPLPTPETKQPGLASVYALSKYDQERLCLIFGSAYRIPAVALRLFNVYGPRQALSNPYTGVLAIFACRLLHRRPPVIFEDGRQRRDFVSVHDVARAFVLALDSPAAPGNVYNIGSGLSFTVSGVAEMLARAIGCEGIAPEITGRYRAGDIRHCFADIGKAREDLGYRPAVWPATGIEELAEWLAGQQAIDRVEEAATQLASRGLAV